MKLKLLTVVVVGVGLFVLFRQPGAPQPEGDAKQSEGAPPNEPPPPSSSSAAIPLTPREKSTAPQTPSADQATLDRLKAEEQAAQAAAIVKDYRNSFVFVTGEGAGSGFITQLAGHSVLVTNAHVAAGVTGAQFKPLDGPPIAVGTPSVAVGHDIFVMEAPSAAQTLEIMQGVEQNVSIGDGVVVLGNSEGAGVINTLLGKVVGIGPNLVEVDAPFQPGNSGSPIIHLKSRKIIGVATYLTIRKYDPATHQAVSDPVIRRFGYRLDTIKSWQAVNWTTFRAQAAEMQKIEALTDDLVAFLNDLASNSGTLKIRHSNPAIRGPIDNWLATRKRYASLADSQNANQTLLAFLKSASQVDVTAARPRMTYDYFERALASQQRDRNELSDIFGKIMQRLR